MGRLCGPPGGPYTAPSVGKSCRDHVGDSMLAGTTRMLARGKPARDVAGLTVALGPRTKSPGDRMPGFQHPCRGTGFARPAGLVAAPAGVGWAPGTGAEGR